MSKILKVQDLYDSYNDSHFGYLGINLDTNEVGLYSDDERRYNGECIYKINNNDEDFYWEFYHNGEYKRLGLSSLSEDYQKIIIELLHNHIKYSEEKGYKVNNILNVVDNLALSFNDGKFTTEIPYYNLYNNLSILNLPVLLMNTENEEVPTKEQIEEYRSLKAAIEVYHVIPMFGKGRYYEVREKKYKSDKAKIASEEMQKVRKYLESQKQNKREKIKCLNSILFGLGEIKNSSILLDEDKNLAKIRIGFYEDILKIEDTKKTDDNNNFIFTTPTYMRTNRRGKNLELVFNDLECRDIDKNYKSVIKQTYGPLLDFITEGKLRQARYNGGISEFHQIMFEIIPDINISEELLDLIENGNSDEEVFKQLTIYAEAVIENKNLEGKELYEYIKKCKLLKSQKIKYEHINFEKYMESSLNFEKICKIYKKLISQNKGRKIYDLADTINNYANENPDSLELQILDIFAQKYLIHHRYEVVGSKLSIGSMVGLMQLHRVEDESLEFTEDGETFIEAHGETKKRLEKIEDQFHVFIPEELKYALINEKDMEIEMNKIFDKQPEKNINVTLRRIRESLKNHKKHNQ